MKWLLRRRPWLFLQPGDLRAIVLVVAILLGAAVFAITLGMLPYNPFKSDFGLGPEWECSNPGYGDPVCIKRRPQPK